MVFDLKICMVILVLSLYMRGPQFYDSYNRSDGWAHDGEITGKCKSIHVMRSVLVLNAMRNVLVLCAMICQDKVQGFCCKQVSPRVH